MPTIQWVTFDCYGTLIDWESGIADALAPFLPDSVSRKALVSRYTALEAAVEKEAYLPYREVLAKTSRLVLSTLGHPLPPGREHVLPDSLPTWRAFPEVPDALRLLRAAGYRLAILSNVDRDLLAASITHLGVAPDLMITAEDSRSYKPAAGHWVLFQERSGASRQNTVHVAASLYHDIVPAGALDYRTVFIKRHRVEPVGDARPTRVLPDLRRLPQTIAELDAGPEAPRAPRRSREPT